MSEHNRVSKKSIDKKQTGTSNSILKKIPSIYLNRDAEART